MYSLSSYSSVPIARFPLDDKEDKGPYIYDVRIKLLNHPQFYPNFSLYKSLCPQFEVNFSDPPPPPRVDVIYLWSLRKISVIRRLISSLGHTKDLIRILKKCYTHGLPKTSRSRDIIPAKTRAFDII